MHRTSSLRQLAPFFLGVGLCLGLAPLDLAARLLGLALIVSGVLFLRPATPRARPVTRGDLEVWGDE